MNDKYVKV
jgi:hypothetical protein